MKTKIKKPIKKIVKTVVPEVTPVVPPPNKNVYEVAYTFIFDENGKEVSGKILVIVPTLPEVINKLYEYVQALVNTSMGTVSLTKVHIDYFKKATENFVII
jgi:hypothetical protein